MDLDCLRKGVTDSPGNRLVSKSRVEEDFAKSGRNAGITGAIQPVFVVLR